MNRSKTRSLKSILICLSVSYFTSCTQPNLVDNIKTTNTAVASVDTSRIAIINYDEKYKLGFENSKPSILTNEDIKIIEGTLVTCIKEYNAKMDKLIEKENSRSPNNHFKKEDYFITLTKYKRQYVAVTNKNGEKEVWVNCFCYDWGKDWKKQIISAFDGGNCFFNLKINLGTGKYHDFGVNGYA